MQTLPVPPQRGHIFVDNQAALFGIKSPGKARYQPVRDAYEKLSNHPLNFSLHVHWVKAHLNITANEFADSLTKQGAMAMGAGSRKDVPLTKRSWTNHVISCSICNLLLGNPVVPVSFAQYFSYFSGHLHLHLPHPTPPTQKARLPRQCP